MYKIEAINELPQNDDVRAWFESQLKNKGAKTLLAFAYDGVIWGSWNGASLTLALNAPTLRGETLQQAYIFDADEEVRLFRDELGNGWKSVKVSSDTNDPERVMVEKQILWGDKLDQNQPQTGFLHVQAERKGIPNQMIPASGTFGKNSYVRLTVHHLVDYDSETGEAYIKLSRLAGLSVEEKA